jgi:FkbM family methyltransferase
MKIAFLYGPFSLGNPPPPDRLFDFANLWESPRGMTGSEHSCVSYAAEMCRRGHEVTLYVPQDGPDFSPGVKVRNLTHLSAEGGRFDVVYTWNEPDLLRAVPSGPMRMMNQQLNDFGYCQPGWEQCVDVLTAPSQPHLEYLRRLSHEAKSRKGEVVPNGCNPTIYDLTKKVPGRVAYISSPDRGLHWLLQEWPKIRKRVPEAHLRIYYYSLQRWIDHVKVITPAHPSESLREQGKRARYIDQMLPMLRGHGVELVGGVSRVQMARELSEAMVLAYPCDTVSWTEGFSVSTLEGCASGAIPVITNVDALGGIYGGYVPMVDAPVGRHLAEWAEHVIAHLKPGVHRETVVRQARMRAEHFAWPKLGRELEEMIYRHCPRLNANSERHVVMEPVEQKPTALRGPTRTEVRQFRGRSYNLRCTDYVRRGIPNEPFQHPSWFSFDDESEVRNRHWDIAPGDYVLDVGAAYGSYALPALACGAQAVWAWSPQGPEGEQPERDFLLQSFDANPEWKKAGQTLTVYDHGVYSREGWIDTATQAYSQTATGGKDEIHVTTIDRWMSSIGVNAYPRTVFCRWWMKLDVEGAEVEVLRGADLFIDLFRPRILVECHNFKRHSLEREVREHLEGCGYLHVATHPHHGVSHSFFMPK